MNKHLISSKKLSTLLVPAYKAAINGFPVNERYLKGANYKKEWLKKYKETEINSVKTREMDFAA